MVGYIELEVANFYDFMVTYLSSLSYDNNFYNLKDGFQQIIEKLTENIKIFLQIQNVKI